MNEDHFPQPTPLPRSPLSMAPGPWAVTPSGGIAFSGSAGFNLEPWGNNDPVPPEILRLIAASPTLVTTLLDLCRAFEAHLIGEAKRAGVTVRELCPCFDNELSKARALLSKVDVR